MAAMRLARHESNRVRNQEVRPTRETDVPDVPDASILTMRSLTKTYVSKAGEEVHALAPVDLEIRAGEFISLVGPSGCGKSTLLNMIGALLEPTEGEARYRGEVLARPHRDIGVMFQTPVLLPWRTVRRNILLPAEIQGIPESDLQARLTRMLEIVGLTDFADAYPRQLSGGMQQRAALARVLTYEPQVLLMDEPFGALDEFTREAMNLELSRVATETGITVILVTHNIQEAVFLADRVVVMSPRPGRVVDVVQVPFEKPREIDMMRDPKFTELTFAVRHMLGGGSK